MKLSAPKKAVWLVAIVLGLLGIIGHFVDLGTISSYQFWLVSAGFVILALSTMFKDF